MSSIKISHCSIFQHFFQFTKAFNFSFKERRKSRKWIFCISFMDACFPKSGYKFLRLHRLKISWGNTQWMCEAENMNKEIWMAINIKAWEAKNGFHSVWSTKHKGWFNMNEHEWSSVNGSRYDYQQKIRNVQGRVWQGIYKHVRLQITMRKEL